MDEIDKVQRSAKSACTVSAAIAPWIQVAAFEMSFNVEFETEITGHIPGTAGKL